MEVLKRRGTVVKILSRCWNKSSYLEVLEGPALVGERLG